MAYNYEIVDALKGDNLDDAVQLIKAEINDYPNLFTLLEDISEGVDHSLYSEKYKRLIEALGRDLGDKVFIELMEKGNLPRWAKNNPIILKAAFPAKYDKALSIIAEMRAQQLSPEGAREFLFRDYQDNPYNLDLLNIIDNQYYNKGSHLSLAIRLLESDELDAIREIIRQSPDPEINAADALGRTPLHYALVGKQGSIARLLIERGADLRAKNTEGKTPIDIAMSFIKYARHEKIASVIDIFMDVNIADDDGKNMLMHAIEANNVELVEALLAKGADPNAKDNKGYTAIDYTFYSDPKINAMLSKALKVEDLSENQLNQYFEGALVKGNATLAARLLQDPRLDVTANDYAAIKTAIQKGNVHMCQVLLAKCKIDVNKNNFELLKLAASTHNVGIAEAMVFSSKYFGFPLSQICDSRQEDFLHRLDAFLADPLEFCQTQGKLPPVPSAAMGILSRQKQIKDMEMRQRDTVANDPESAMQDITVQKSKAFFTLLKEKFQSKFDAYGGEKKSIVAIEEEIRGMILDRILDEITSDEQKKFINDNKAALMKADDPALMKRAREEFFKSDLPAHSAWRSYDKDAPSTGFDNLLTEQSSEKGVFSTRSAGAGAMTNVDASDQVREMVAFYYLLVNDKEDGVGGTDEEVKARIANRRANFISELADLRRAHSEDHEGHPDAPSCYPGYLGRLANLGYEHPMAKSNVSAKTALPDIMRPIIHKKFMESMEGKSEEECKSLLDALSNLTERDAIRVLSGDIVYDEDLLKKRNDFIALLGDSYDVIISVNKELLDRGYPELTKDEEGYVYQYLLDPARGANMGVLGAEFIKRFAASNQGPVGNPYQELLERPVGMLPQQLQVVMIRMARKFTDKEKLTLNENLQKWPPLGDYETVRKIFEIHNIDLNILEKGIQIIGERATTLKNKAALWGMLHGQAQGLSDTDRDILIKHLQSIVDGIFADPKNKEKFMALPTQPQERILDDIAKDLSTNDAVMQAEDPRECASIVSEIVDQAISKAETRLESQVKRSMPLRLSRGSETGPEAEKPSLTRSKPS